MIFELDVDEKDVVRALRNVKEHPNNKSYTDILLSIIDDILEKYRNAE